MMKKYNIFIWGAVAGALLMLVVISLDSSLAECVLKSIKRG